MPAKLLIPIADAVAALLPAGTFAGAQAAERVYDWESLVEELQLEAKARVIVVPGGVGGEWESRADIEEEVLIDVGLCQKIKAAKASEKPELDALIELLEEIQQRLLINAGGPRHLASDPDAVCTAAKIEPAYSPKHLRELRTYLGVVHCTFQLLREV